MSVVSRELPGRAVCVALVGACVVSGFATAAPASFPPPGSAVFSKEVEGKRVLFVGRSDGSQAVRITSGPNDYEPQWSPGGRRIVFERTTAEDESSVWIVNADGTGERQLDGDPYAEHPRWSPDGRWIAYQVQTSEHVADGRRADTTFELWLVRPSGAGLRLLAESGEGALGKENARFYVRSGAWAWSPDSRRMAFIRPRAADGEKRGGVHVVDVASGASRYLGPGVDVSWSPDGRLLAVTTNDEGISDAPECGTIWIVSVSSGKRRRVGPPSQQRCDRFPRWSPDGRTIVFGRAGRPSGFVATTGESTTASRLTRLAPAAHRWPRDCSSLFEYVNPFRSGWVVRDGRGGLHFVPAIVAQSDWRCTTSSSG